ncbi:uncharacterized protein LOC142898491 [Nelusetta ayraudi]|uniref:uncharacterized protein LOC142898491 n=1 Tax=Nelusetta ayraudi TaxID=303726 RepID=UPI003F727B4E
MEAGECVLPAARAVLELLEREWQPLSPGELELRLDQAVEESLEAELVSGLQARPPPACCWLQEGPHDREAALLGRASPAAAAASCRTPVEEGTPEVRDRQQDAGAAAVQRITELLQSSESRARLAGRARLSLSQTIRLSLTLLGQRLSYRSVSRRFHLEKGNIHRIFFSFCQRLSALEEVLVRLPAGPEAADTLVPLWRSEKQQQQQQQQQDAVPTVLGVLGHTRIPIRPPVGKQSEEAKSAVAEAKRPRREAPRRDSCLHLQLLCDRRGRFLHCRVSRASDPDPDPGGALRDKLRQLSAPPGCWIVAPAGFPLGAHVLTPYREAGGEREQLFNQKLAEHQQVLRQAVAHLKARFPRLRYLDVGNYSRARAVVLAACVLHNVLLDLGQEVHGEVEEQQEEEEEEDTGGGGGDGSEDEQAAQRRDEVSELLFRALTAD